VPKLMRLRVSAVGALPRPPLGSRDVLDPAVPSLAVRQGSLLLPSATGRIAARVVQRNSLGESETLTGPAVIEETYCSTIVLPRQRAECDTLGNIVLTTEPR